MNQLSKNTVDSANQLKNKGSVYFENPQGKGTRVMFVGNSITLHGYKPEIGWHGVWGMAASAKELDYAHLCMKEILDMDPEASFCICQVSEWERVYTNGEEKFHLYDTAREFGADIIIMRAVENCPADNVDNTTFCNQLHKLLCHLNPEGKAKIIITTGFWKHPADGAIREYAGEHQLPLCELGDLGELDEMKAIGLFEHTGVANHPGDRGMRAIADRIMEKVRELI